MRKTYKQILKNHFYNHLISTREVLKLTQAQMAEHLAMDNRSYINLDHGKCSCSALTFALYLIYFCKDPKDYLDDLRLALESANDRVA